MRRAFPLLAVQRVCCRTNLLVRAVRNRPTLCEIVDPGRQPRVRLDGIVVTEVPAQSAGARS